MIKDKIVLVVTGTEKQNIYVKSSTHPVVDEKGEPYQKAKR